MEILHNLTISPLYVFPYNKTLSSYKMTKWENCEVSSFVLLCFTTLILHWERRCKYRSSWFVKCHSYWKIWVQTKSKLVNVSMILLKMEKIWNICDRFLYFSPFWKGLSKNVNLFVQTLTCFDISSFCFTQTFETKMFCFIRFSVCSVCSS